MFNKNPRKALILAIATVLMWSSVATAFKLALNSIDPAQLIALGLSLASLILGSYVLVSGEWHEIKSLNKKELINILGQGLSLFFYYFFLFNAYATLPAQIAQPINNTWAFVLVCLSALILKTKVTKGEVTGMLLAYVGVAVIALGGVNSEVFSAEISLFGLTCAVSCTFFMALYWIINNKSNASHRISLLCGFIIAALLGWIFLIIQSPADRGLWENLTSQAFLATLYLACFEWVIPFITWSLALRLTNSIPTITCLSFFIPFLSLFWINLILHEAILQTTYTGLVCIILGTLIQQKYKSKAA